MVPSITPVPTKGEVVVENPSPTSEPVSGGGYPPAVFAAQEKLVGFLNIPAEQVEVLDIIPVDWPDSCLGIEMEEMCAEVITPGYRIILRVGIARYEFHTNADGSAVRQSIEVTPDTSGEEVHYAFTWQSQGCAVFSVTLETAFYGTCESTLKAAEFVTTEQLQVVSDWVQAYAPFTANTPVGKVGLNGFGRLTATEAEQRMMAEWARLSFAVAQSGRSGAAWGLALAWSRKGGIAGFCDDVGVYLDGSVVVSSCKTGDASLRALRLNATQLEQLYAWVDAFKSVEQVTTDPAQADAMTLQLYLYGEGETQPDEETLRAMSEFAAELAAQVSFKAQAGEELLTPEKVLQDFYQALSAGDYNRAAGLYRGETGVLEGYNPGLEGRLPALLENACTVNGFQCLSVRSVRYRGPDERGGYQFIVEFMNPDGTLFRQGPCCGDESGTSTSSFLVSTIQQDGSWQVMDLPPYVP